MKKNIPKYIIEKMERIEKYRNKISSLSGDIDKWLFENTGLDSVNDSILQKEMYELKYGCGSSEELLRLIKEKI